MDQEFFTKRLFLEEKEPRLDTSRNIFPFNDMKRVLKYVSFRFSACNKFFVLCKRCCLLIFYSKQNLTMN